MGGELASTVVGHGTHVADGGGTVCVAIAGLVVVPHDR